MSKLLSAVLGATLFLGLVQDSLASVLFFGGDQDPTAVSSDLFLVDGPGEAGVAAFDDFTVTSDSWQLQKLSLNFVSLATSFAPYAQCEIRSEVANGTGGTLVWEDQTAAATYTATGRVFGARNEYRLSVDVSNLTLSKGTYFLMLRPFTSVFVAPSNGSGAVGAPILNNNSYARSTFAMYNYRPISEIMNRSSFDMSYMIEGTAVPEPASGLVPSLFGLGVLRRRKNGREV